MAAAGAVVVSPGVAAADPLGHTGIRSAMSAAVAVGVPGSIARADDLQGSWRGSAGTSQLGLQRPRQTNERFRVGSVSKTFAATVVLQLEAERRLSLGDTVEHWLPGMVSGNGNDGSRITLRQLLNHTSGIYDYVVDPAFQQRIGTEDFLWHRFDTWRPEDLIRIAMSHAPLFPAGSAWGYSSTDYILAGLVIEKATGHPPDREIERRIITPLRLYGTSIPGTSPVIPGPHGHGYTKFTPGGPSYDTTAINPSWGGTAGDIISTTSDLNRFMRALIGGNLLPRRQLAEMLDAVPTGDRLRTGYGLGIFRFQFPCGTTVWGHTGGIHGYTTFVGTTPDTRHTLSVNNNVYGAGSVQAIAQAEFCASASHP
ncbi:serine hydrolase domain-containing protein [Streptomyces olivoreticuli]